MKTKELSIKLPKFERAVKVNKHIKSIKLKVIKPTKHSLDEEYDEEVLFESHLEDYDNIGGTKNVEIENVEKIVDKKPIDPILKKAEYKKSVKEEKKKYYVEPKRLSDLIEKFYETGKMEDELAIAVYNIATRLSFAPNFCNYSWKEEMIGDALTKELQAIRNKKYDPKRGNAFSYFTKVAYNAFRNRIKIENKEHKTVKDLQQETYDTLTTQHRRITTNEPENDD